MFRFPDLTHPLASAESQEQYEEIVFRLVADCVARRQTSFAEIIQSLPSVYPAAVLRAVDKIAKTSSAAREIAATARASRESTKRRSTYGRLTPHPLDCDWRFTGEAVKYLLRRAELLSSPASVWIGFGTPSLFHSHSRRRRILIDSNPKISALVRRTQNTEFRICDLLHDDVPDINGDLVVLDPPWYQHETEAFLWAARQVCRRSGTVFLAVPQVGTRPGMRKEFQQLAKWNEQLGFATIGFEQDVLSYESPPFENLALRAAGVMNYPSNWRRADLLELQPRSASSVPRPANAESSIWDEITFGDVRVRIIADRTVAYRCPILRSLTEADSPANVSRRDLRKRRAKLWTSSNRIFDTAAPWIIYEISRALSEGGSIPNRIEARLNQKLTRVQRVEIATVTRQLRSLIGREKQEAITGRALLGQKISRGTDQSVSSNVARTEAMLPTSAKIPRHVGLHLAVFVEPYLKFVLQGKKTVESRFSITRRAPFRRVRPGDVILLKRSGGPIVGICRVAQTWFYTLDPKSWKYLRKEFAERLCAEDPVFWSMRAHAKFASLLRIEDVQRLPPLPFAKTDRRGWVVLREAPLSSSGKIDLLIGIAGLPGSGKTSVAEQVGYLLDAQVVAFGDFFRALADRNDLQEFGARYISSRSSETAIEEFLAFCKLIPNRPVVVEGIRHVAIWRALARRAKTARLAFLDIEESVLEHRLSTRIGRVELRPEDRLQHPVEAESPKLHAAADIVVESRDALKAATSIVREVRSAK